MTVVDYWRCYMKGRERLVGGILGRCETAAHGLYTVYSIQYIQIYNIIIYNYIAYTCTCDKTKKYD